MGLPSFRRYDVQAKYSLMISLTGVIPLAAAAYVSWTKYDPSLRAIQYGSTGLFKVGFLVCIAASAALSLGGLGLGFSSAGQRRNNAQAASWLGFFLGSAVLSLSIIVFAAFASLGLEITVG